MFSLLTPNRSYKSPGMTREHSPPAWLLHMPATNIDSILLFYKLPSSRSLSLDI
ncbi:hypothetical protein DAPPUDRAFT_238432 [Daphnia pulex]|uniref:Uncharacterized protein n=1 Tax=Daphnia pulex TaxID=6669 RepID=E9G6D8_DAPPU|nr:hypothetical protein DAPPUDRAFT_238432 [Daphnia pulex]|eukprot:EFX85009.1 hypothetical protein DAPPUDRAFT_238432 [Daphnia pulex]